MNCESFKKRRIICISSIKEAVLKYFHTFFSGGFLTKRNKISNTSMKRYAETGSAWQAPLCQLNIG